MSERYQVAYLERDTCGPDTASFRFARPEAFAFSAGQWARVGLATSAGHEVKTFTISSAPGDPYVEITTRLSGSSFKNALLELSEGDTVELAGPGGRLTLPDSVSRIAFLAGGVGITPVRSILRDARQRSRAFDDALLMYGNRDETCVPFAEEFLGMDDLGVRTVLAFERAGESWAGERGFITAEMVRRYLDPHADDRPFLVAGPPAMVDAMVRVLDDLDVPRERRMVELFSAGK